MQHRHFGFHVLIIIAILFLKIHFRLLILFLLHFGFRILLALRCIINSTLSTRHRSLILHSSQKLRYFYLFFSFRFLELFFVQPIISGDIVKYFGVLSKKYRLAIVLWIFCPPWSLSNFTKKQKLIFTANFQRLNTLVQIHSRCIIIPYSYKSNLLFFLKTYSELKSSIFLISH